MTDNTEHWLMSTGNEEARPTIW